MPAVRKREFERERTNAETRARSRARGEGGSASPWLRASKRAAKTEQLKGLAEVISRRRLLVSS